MKIKIGGYPTWWGPYQIASLICFWAKPDVDEYGYKSEPDWVHKFGSWLSEDRHGNNSWITNTCQWYHKRFQQNGDRKVKVHIDNADVYSADHTLALIIAPMLRKLQEKKNGSPMIDNEDLPPELQMSERETTVNDNGHWDKSLDATEEEQDAASKKFHARWEWVLSEMIWAFEQHEKADWEDQFHTGEHDIIWTKVDAKGNELAEGREGNTYSRMDHGPNNTHVYDAEGSQAWSARMANGRRLFAKYYEALWW